jgi:alpha-beta hydrolase superfamily lysophospholipase
MGGSGRPTVILMHGVRADRRALFKRASLFKNAGYSVLLFDFQAHGESEGRRITFGFLESRDAHAAFDFAKAKRPGAPVGVVGLSLGGAAALLGMDPVGADALVLEAVYPDIRAATNNRIRRWIGPVSGVLTSIFMLQLSFRLDISESELRPIDHIGRFKKPVLILSGSDDLHTTRRDTEDLYAAANEPKRLVFFDGARHQDLFNYDPVKYESVLQAFFGKYLEN